MRVQVNLSDEMVAKVDYYAHMMGVSRSALCSVLVGQGIMGFDKAADVISSLGDMLGKSLIAEDKIK